MYVGVRPTDYQHRFEALYRYRTYNGYVRIPPRLERQPHQLFKTTHDPALHTEEPSYSNKDRNTFQTLDFRSTWFLTPRVSVMVTVPLVSSWLRLDDEISRSSGIGDISAVANWFVFRVDSNAFAIQGQVHTGLKLPTGAYTRDAAAFAAAAHTQNGTGSVDGLLGSTISGRFQRWSSATTALWMLNNANGLGYRYRNTLAITHLFAYDWQWLPPRSSVHIIPQAGIYYENHNGEELNGDWQAGTGGQALFGCLGADILVGQMGFHCMAQLPVYQDLLGTQLGNAGRFIVGLNYNFRSLKVPKKRVVRDYVD